MKFQTISVILLGFLAFAGLPSASALKLIWDRGYVLIIANEKQHFSYDFFAPLLEIRLRDEHGHGGYLSLGENRDGQRIMANVTEMSFVVEPVATDELPVSAQDEDQVWFKESSPVLLKSVSAIEDKIRIRELTGREQYIIDSYKKNPNNKKEKFMVFYNQGTVIVQATPVLTSINNGGSQEAFIIIGMEEEEEMIAAQVEGAQGNVFVIKGSNEPVKNCGKLTPRLEFYCRGNLQLTELN